MIFFRSSGEALSQVVLCLFPIPVAYSIAASLSAFIITFLIPFLFEWNHSLQWAFFILKGSRDFLSTVSESFASCLLECSIRKQRKQFDEEVSPLLTLKKGSKAYPIFNVLSCIQARYE